MNTARSYYEKRRAELHVEWKRLDEQKPYAWILLLAGGGLFIGNVMGIEGPTNKTLGGLTLGAVLAGGFWLWHIQKEIGLNNQRSVENNKELDSLPAERPPS